MTEIRFNVERCKECSFCVDVCPQKIVQMSDKRNKKGYHYAKVVDKEKCTGCGLCFQMCPDMCIEIEK